MLRFARLVLAALVCALLFGCKTSEIKNETSGPVPGLADDIPAGTVQSGYGSGGDSVGGGGAAAPLDLHRDSAGK